jgi:uncharacterized repeat protein (TIGR01451 family)
MLRPIVHCIALLLFSFGIAAMAATPASAQPFSSSAVAELGHDTSPTLQSLANNVKIQQLCAQAPSQLLPNSTGLTIDQDFCGYTPTPSPLPGGVIASDNSGAAGPNNYFQTENYSAVIFDKKGQVVLGPFLNLTIWNGFSSPNSSCSANLSDVVVLYDHAAQRWFVSKFAGVLNADGSTSWYQCFAVSTSTDPTGTYYRYVFAIDPTDWNDYPKFGIWPDAYYMTANNRFNVKNATAPIAHFIVAFERSAMIAGQTAREIIFKIDNGGLRAHILPADWDGQTQPPAGSPNYLARPLDTNLGWPMSAIEIWTAAVNWAAGTGVLTLQATLPQNPFNSNICSTKPLNQDCIPQPGTTQGLDPLAFGMMMYRLAYRNFDDHESLVFTQTVEAADFDDHAAIRWYELRRSGGAWSIYQQSTFAPDSDHRWMGSIAMDRFGNMAMGYNVSSFSTFPGIRLAGRRPGDPVNQITEAAILTPGLGSETGTVFFADYSQTTLDPLDDCTFWHAGTYQPATANNQQFSWATKIGSFRFPDCVADLAVTKTRSPSGAIEAGTNVTYTVTVTNNGPADAGNVTLADTLAAGTGFVSITAPAAWTCTTPQLGQPGAITCTAMSLPGGTNAVFSIAARVNCSTADGTVISNTATVSAQTPPDNNHNNDTQSVSFTVFNPVPVVTASALDFLKQNNHELVNVGLAAFAADGACPAPTTFAVEIFGNEDDETPTGNGNGAVFSPDAKDVAVATLELRKERRAGGDGRVYLIVVKATDTAGGTGFATLTVVVPKSSSRANIAAVNALAASAKAFADSNGGAPPAAYVLIGDGPVIGSKQ